MCLVSPILLVQCIADLSEGSRDVPLLNNHHSHRSHFGLGTLSISLGTMPPRRGEGGKRGAAPASGDKRGFGLLASLQEDEDEPVAPPPAKAPRRGRGGSSQGGLLQAASARSSSSRGGKAKLCGELGDGMRCRRCLAKHPDTPGAAQIEWCEKQIDGELDKCKKCETIHNTVRPMTYADFCDRYHNAAHKAFKDDVDKADSIYEENEEADFPEEFMDEASGTEFVLNKQVLALTNAEMKSSGVADPETFPKVTFPNGKGQPSTWYLAQDQRFPYHTMSVSRKMSCSSSQRLVDGSQVYFKGQTGQQMNFHTNSKLDELGLKVLFGNVPRLPMQQAMEGGPVLAPAPASVIPAGLNPAALASLGGVSPSKGAPSVAGSAAGASPPPSVISAASVPANVCRSIPFGRAASNIFEGEEDDVASASGLTSFGLIEKKGLEDIRKMNAHQKASYWHGRISVRACILGLADKKSIRQGNDHLERHKDTSDPTLKSLLDTLANRLEMADIAESLAPKFVATIEDEKQYKIYIDKLKSEFEQGWPTEVEVGMVKRRLLLLRGKLEEWQQFLQCSLPWVSDPQLAIFDPMVPILGATSSTEPDKAALFSSFFVYDLVDVFIKKGEPDKKKFKEFAMKAQDVLISSQKGAELEQEAAVVCLEALGALRGLHCLLEDRLSPTTLKDKHINAVKRFFDEAADPKQNNIIASTGRLIMKSEHFMAPLLQNFIKSSDTLLACSGKLVAAHNFLAGLKVDETDTKNVHETLSGYLDDIVDWMMKLQEGFCDDLAGQLCTKVVEHCTEVIKNRSTEALGQDIVEPNLAGITKMINSAAKVWPMSESFPALRDKLVVVQADLGKNERMVALEAEAAKVEKHFAEKLKKKQFDLDPEVTMEFYSAVSLADQTPSSEYPPSVDKLWEVVVGALSSKMALASEAAKDGCFTLLENIEALYEQTNKEHYTYMKVIRTGLKKGHEMARGIAIIAASGGAGHARYLADEKLMLKNSLAVSSAMKSYSILRPKSPALPSGCTWAEVDSTNALATSTLEDIYTAGVADARAKLASAMSDLDGVAHGSQDNETWHGDYDEHKNSPKAEDIWNAAVDKLLKVNVPDLDKKIKAVNACCDVLDRVTECFEKKTAEDTAWKTESGRIVTRARITKISATVAWIWRSHQDDEVAMRIKCEGQLKLLKAFTDWERLTHERIRSIIDSAMNMS